MEKKGWGMNGFDFIPVVGEAGIGWGAARFGRKNRCQNIEKMVDKLRSKAYYRDKERQGGENFGK